MSASGVDADVAIVGLGPVGVVAANCLGQYGVSTIAFERDSDIYQRARAVTVNDWTLRIFQSFGLDQLAAADMDANGALRWKIYEGRKEVFRAIPAGSSLGHPASMMIYQPTMEATLRRGVDRFADHVAVHFGSVVAGVDQDGAAVTLRVRDLDGANEHTVRTSYVIACDGGSSGIRSQLAVELLGTTHETTWIVIDGEVLRWWPDCNQLVFWSDPERPVVDIPLALGHHRWELPLRDGESRADFDTEEKLWSLLAPLGISPTQVRLKHHAFYVHHVRQADRWRVGRVFLAGDAAHLMPPWAGQGMQSGIRDAQNLCWKLRAVLEGRLGDEVLDSYQPERAPQVAMVTELSRRLGQLIATRNPTAIALRNNVGPILARLPALGGKLMRSGAPAIAEGWLRGPVGKRSAVGQMLPQPTVCTAQGRRIRLDEALGDGFAVLGLDRDPRSEMSPEEADGWDALGCRWIAARNPGSAAASASEIIDLHGELARWMRRHRTSAVAVRPDRFVAASAPTGMATPTSARAVAPGLASAGVPDAKDQ